MAKFRIMEGRVSRTNAQHGSEGIGQIRETIHLLPGNVMMRDGSLAPSRGADKPDCGFESRSLP